MHPSYSVIRISAYLLPADMLRRFLNLSTRPPASTNFCLPVKNGWHFEQISTRRSPLVDLVLTTSPHAQVIVHSLYSGWRPCFISFAPHIQIQSTINYTLFFQKNQVVLQNFSKYFSHSRKSHRNPRRKRIFSCVFTHRCPFYLPFDDFS